RFLEEVLARDGIASETVESAPGRGNLVARLRGDGSEGGIVLHHHIDVVYADRRYWTVDPFGGEIRDGFLYGRGAIDMKSTGMLHLAALFGSIVTSEKTGLPLRLTARSEPGHGSMPWPETAPNRLIRALGRLLEAERPLRILPEIQEYFAKLGSVLPGEAGRGYDDLERSLRDEGFRRAFLAKRLHAAMLR